jgi:hypothetical protein
VEAIGLAVLAARIVEEVQHIITQEQSIKLIIYRYRYNTTHKTLFPLFRFFLRGKGSNENDDDDLLTLGLVWLDNVCNE